MKTRLYTYVLLGVTLFCSVLIVYHLKLSLALAWPTNNSWLFRGDWAQHYLSWEMFRALPWQWPLGTLGNYFYPVGSNIGYTDTIPLLAFGFKLLSPLLPPDFQYIGLWLLLCFLLQAFFGVLLLRALKFNHPVSLFAGAMFFVLSPVLLFRIGHPALCAHWLILGSLWIYFTDYTQHPLRCKIYQLTLLLLSAFIHPYLTVIVFSFTIIYFFRLWIVDKIIGIGQLLLLSIIAVGIVVLSWYVIGYFSLPAKDAWETGGGFTIFAANILGFINPFEYSTFLQGIPLQLDGQREGFAYLGLGMMVLVVITVIKKIFELIKHHYQIPDTTHRPWLQFIPLLFLALIFTIFSLSSTINAGATTLFAYHLPEWAVHLTDTFRAAGRFIWVTYYIIFALAFYALRRLHISNTWLTIILIVTLMIQIVDLAPLIHSKQNNTGKYQTTLSQEWTDLVRSADVMVMYPPFRQDYLVPRDYMEFVYLAHKYNLAITTGYLARYDSAAYAQYLNALQSALHDGSPEKNAVYITTPEHQNEFDTWLNKNLVKKINLDGYVVFIPMS